MNQTHDAALSHILIFANVAVAVAVRLARHAVALVDELAIAWHVRQIKAAGRASLNCSKSRLEFRN